MMRGRERGRSMVYYAYKSQCIYPEWGRRRNWAIKKKRGKRMDGWINLIFILLATHEPNRI